jgi:hemerythrin superfamily protein
VKKKPSKLQKVSLQPKHPESKNVVSLLLKDHKAMRKLMGQIKSKRSKSVKIFSSFKKLEKLVYSHMKAEESSLLNKIVEHPIFEDEAKEGIEEHRIHETVMEGVHRLKDKERQITHIKIFCEFLEHHLDEEEEDLFPAFKKYTALSTQKKIGAAFMKKRIDTQPKGKKLGALANT